MKDGRTHLAHTAEQAVDLATGGIVGVTAQDADDGDTTTMLETLITAAEQVEAVLPAGTGIGEVVGDKRYHSNDTMVAFAALGVRSYVSAPDRGRRHWKDKAAARDAVYANRRRIRGHPWAAVAAAAGRAARTSQRASLRDRADAPDVSARASQHPEAPARACRRLQSRVTHAAADGCLARRGASKAARPPSAPR